MTTNTRDIRKILRAGLDVLARDDMAKKTLGGKIGAFAKEYRVPIATSLAGTAAYLAPHVLPQSKKKKQYVVINFGKAAP